jgi:alginate O-acetyltransferase complex protein AlgI
LAYALQIYCDFSGYSDMAVGTAKMIGYDLPQNFAMPYLSRDITEFWRRWHITLSTWLRDYLYIPLGGNRLGRRRTYFNLLATMALGGLWHGASWNFVLWGVVHGVALALHKWLRNLLGERRLLPSIVGRCATFFFVLVAWVPFRASSFADTLTMLSKMFSWSHEGMLWEPWYLYPALALLALGHLVGAAVNASGGNAGIARGLSSVLSVFGIRVERNAVSGWHLRLSLYPTAGAFLVTLWLLLVGLFSSGNTKPFIYFQF